jgi:hypothetical protein
MLRRFLYAAAFALAAPASLAQDVDALEAQLDKAREKAPMTIRNFMLSTRPAKHFGDFESRSGNVVGKDEKLNFYAEPRNLVPKFSNGVYELGLEVDIEVKPEKGEAQKQAKFMAVRIPSRSRVQDLYLNMAVSLGGAPPGKYNVKFVVRDANSKKSATVAQDVVIK